MKSAINGLLFDKDGTLFDFNATWGVWCHEFITDMAAGDKDLEVRLAGMLEYDFNSKAFLPDSLVITDSMDAIIKAAHSALPHMKYEDVFEYVLASGSKAKMHPVVPLAKLMEGFRSSGIKIGVATNDHEQPTLAHLQSVGIAESFDFIAGCDSGYGAKPAPGMLLGFCEAAGLLPAEVAMVGDSNHDLLAGRAAGMTTIGVLTGPANADTLKPLADVILNDISEIPAWLSI